LCPRLRRQSFRPCQHRRRSRASGHRALRTCRSVYRSGDSGEAWSLPASGPAFPNSATIFRDKGYLAADANPASAFAGAVYLTWDDDTYTGCPHVFPQNFLRRDIVFSRSTDQGLNWSDPVVLATGCLVAPVPAVAANGDLFVVWYDCNGGVGQMVRRSRDGGLTFDPAVPAAAGLMPPPNPLLGSAFRVNGAFPAIATDPTEALRLYVTWSSTNGDSQTDVFVTRSLDSGATWDDPVRVNDDAVGNPRDQFMPWIAVLSDATVRVMWGDDRLDAVTPGGKLYDVFVADSADHGASFGENVRVTDGSSDPDLDAFGGTFIGDYFGLSASGIPVWDDMQSGN
jgi:hypothetical protein